jgi:hypothetical protein
MMPQTCLFLMNREKLAYKCVVDSCLDKLRARHLSLGIRTATSAICCEKYELYVVPASMCGT